MVQRFIYTSKEKNYINKILDELGFGKEIDDIRRYNSHIEAQVLHKDNFTSNWDRITKIFPKSKSRILFIDYHATLELGESEEFCEKGEKLYDLIISSLGKVKTTDTLGIEMR